MNAIELFVGAGGLGIGLSRAGFSPLAVIELDRYCCDTIRENQKRRLYPVSHWPLIEQDVRAFDFTSLNGEVEIVTGGPPCQPFSIGGKHRAQADSRDMFPEAVRALRETRPRAFMFENVKGLTRESFAHYFEYIQLQMTYPELAPQTGEDWSDHHFRLQRHHEHGGRQGLCYRVKTRVLNSANYGVPQRRERVFFVGFRADLDIEWSYPEATHSLDALIWDQVYGDYWDRYEVPISDRGISERMRARAARLDNPPRLEPWRTVRDALVGLPDPECDPHAAELHSNHRFQPGARRYVGHTGSPT